MKKQDNHMKHFIVISCLFFIVFAILAYFYNITILKQKFVSNKITKPSLQNKYTSEIMKISVEVPEKFKIVEKLGTIYLNSENNSIIIDRIGTEFENLESYLDDLSKKNNFTVKKKEAVSLNDNIALKTIIINSTNSEIKTYYFYRENWVYDISTSSPEVYDDLDKIAQSFRYTP